MDDVNLNVDILHRVMASSTRITVSHVMRTCRTLNHEGARYLLNRDPYLTTAKQATSFLLFLYARGQASLTANRLYWLEGLSIGSDYDPDRSKEEAFAFTLKHLFTHFAPHACRLVRLDIDQDEGESLFSAEPELGIAISNLDTLRTLTITYAADHTMIMLRALKSRLFHADITFDPDLSRDIADDPVTTLANSQTSLRTLSLGWAAVASSPSPPRYPFLHKLSLSYVALPITWHLVQAFPNLSTISTSEIALRIHFADPHETQEEARMRLRLRNIDDQQRYGSWTSLRSFKGSLSMLFVLGLVCDVSHVDVGNDHDPEETFDLDMLHAVFMDTRPTQLTLRIYFPSHVLLSELADGLMSLCSREEFQVVETCKVHLSMAPGDHDYDVEAFLVALCKAMASTEIDALKLRINWSLLTFRIPTYLFPGRKRSESEPPSSALAYLQSLDANMLVERLFDAVPSIRTAKVSLIGPTSSDTVELERDSSDWRSEHDEPQFDSGDDADVSAEDDELAQY